MVLKGGSLLIIRQVQGLWKVPKDSLRPILQQVLQLQCRFIKCQFWHIPQSQNVRSHEIASKAIAQEGKCML